MPMLGVIVLALCLGGLCGWVFHARWTVVRWKRAETWPGGSFAALTPAAVPAVVRPRSSSFCPPISDLTRPIERLAEIQAVPEFIPEISRERNTTPIDPSSPEQRQLRRVCEIADPDDSTRRRVKS